MYLKRPQDKVQNPPFHFPKKKECPTIILYALGKIRMSCHVEGSFGMFLHFVLAIFQQRLGKWSRGWEGIKHFLLL